jgi:hypothetical protein
LPEHNLRTQTGVPGDATAPVSQAAIHRRFGDEIGVGDAVGEAVAEMHRAVRVGGTIAAYVWDYADGMQLLRRFWDAAVALDPAAGQLDEGRRFPLCRREALRSLLNDVGLEQIEVRAIDVPTVFTNFDDYWSPFLGGQGPAPGYCVSLSDDRRARLRNHLQATLPVASDGTIHLKARAFAVRGIKSA